MPFTGKATYDAGATLPELAEDVSDIVSIVSPYETPLLDHLGDPRAPALSTVHEWIEDALLPNTDLINQTTFTPSATTATSITVDNGAYFQVGDLVRPDESSEVMLVTAIATNTLTVVRAYGGTTAQALADNMKLTILGNAALEGAAAPAARFTTRARRSNYTQIFTATVEVSGSMQAARAAGVADEADYQKAERMRELLRDLENTVLNGVAPAATQQGSSSVRRSMNGIINSIDTNIFTPGAGGFPLGGGTGEDELTETLINAAMRRIWDNASGPVDTIVVGGAQKRRINEFLSAQRGYAPSDTTLRSLVSVYESDFGVCRIITSRWMPAGVALFLDSSRIDVLPLAGRSFQARPLATTGDAISLQILGEYTLEFRNEAAHGLIRGLAA
ncbi:MAG: DUF5309 family protein [Phycisphaeraceae bacterium]|nr:DUF5309 family protein [Phycisphaeraceae bacterium]